MKLLQELRSLLEDAKTDWKELFAKTEDITDKKGSGGMNSYRHKMYGDSDYQLWYFTSDEVKDEDGNDLETFVAFYLGKPYFLGPRGHAIIDWVEHDIYPNQWQHIFDQNLDALDSGHHGDMFNGLYDGDDPSVADHVQSMEVPVRKKIKDYIAAIKRAVTAN
jgi:hypothetical protein